MASAENSNLLTASEAAEIKETVVAAAKLSPGRVSATDQVQDLIHALKILKTATSSAALPEASAAT